MSVIKFQYEKLKIERKVLERLFEIENELDKTKIIQKKRKKLYYDTYPLSRCSADDINEDLYKIKGKLDVKANDKELQIGLILFKRKDNVKIKMHDEIYNGVIYSINSKELVVKTKLGKKVRIQIGSIKNNSVSIVKTH